MLCSFEPISALRCPAVASAVLSPTLACPSLLHAAGILTTWIGMAYLQRASASLLSFALCFAPRSYSVVINDAARPPPSHPLYILSVINDAANPQVWTSRGTGCPAPDEKAIDKLEDSLTVCHLVLIPAGMPRAPGITRDDICKINSDIARDLVDPCAERCPNTALGMSYWNLFS